MNKEVIGKHGKKPQIHSTKSFTLEGSTIGTVVVNHNRSFDDLKKHDSEARCTGNPDLFKLISKVSTQQWSVSTTAMETPDGCIVQCKEKCFFSGNSSISLLFVPNCSVIRSKQHENTYEIAKKSILRRVLRWFSKV